MNNNREDLLQLNDGRYIMDTEQSRVFKIIKDAQPEYSSDYGWDEPSIAILFCECYKDKIKYCQDVKSWYSYDETKWIKDKGARLVNIYLFDFIRLLKLYAGDINTKNIDTTKYATFVNKLLDRRARDRIIKDAQNEAFIAFNEFDRNPYLINCENGTYDLENDSFHFHTPNDFITLKTNCIYVVPTAEINYSCQRWYQFINEITENNKVKADYLQRTLGYSLLGVANEECIFIAWGKTTRNGKGTLFNTIASILGEYSTACDSQIICKSALFKDINKPNPIVASLKGKRYIIMSETSKDAEFDEEVLKQYTGNDIVTARELYGEPFQFRLQGTFWLMCNDLPKTVDPGLISSNRINIIEFTKHFTSEEQDKTLKEQFATKEAKAVIMMWLIEGYKKYKKQGLNIPQEMIDTLNYYELKNDIVKRFINDCCVRDNNRNILKTELRTYFESWRKRLDLPSVSKIVFYNDIEKYFKEIIKNGYAYFRGVSIKEDKNGTNK